MVEPSTPSWTMRVADYLGELSGVVDAMQHTLAQFRPQDAMTDVSRVNAHTARVAELAVQLESMVVTRQTLLVAQDAPQSGITLADKLRATPLDNHQVLAEQCDAINRALENAHQRAVALFTCQYHLAELSADILALIAGTLPPATYAEPGPLPVDGGDAATVSSSQPASHRSTARSNRGGGLFNEAG